MTTLDFFYNPEDIEAGIDEAGRGCLVGRVYAAAVIWPKNIEDDVDLSIIKDSKKLSKKKRTQAIELIDKYALAYNVAWVDEKTIDEINILQATYCAMHKALDGLSIEPEHIIIDGPHFKPYINKEVDFVPHKCIKKGDNKYISIAAASILAKEYRDNYIVELFNSDPKFKPYEWDNNKSYGTKAHLAAIQKHGITKYHRKSFGICKKFS